MGGCESCAAGPLEAHSCRVSSVSWPSCREMMSSRDSKASSLSDVGAGVGPGRDDATVSGRTSSSKGRGTRVTAAGYSHVSPSLLQLRHGWPPVHLDFFLLGDVSLLVSAISQGVACLPARVTSPVDAPDRPIVDVKPRLRPVVSGLRTRSGGAAAGPAAGHVVECDQGRQWMPRSSCVMWELGRRWWGRTLRFPAGAREGRQRG
jgi:hypothetical protein